MRLTTKEREHRNATVEIYGWIVRESADQLKAECDALLDDGKTVELDLSGVNFVDAIGAAVLRLLCRRGAKIVESPHFILDFIGGECRE